MLILPKILNGTYVYCQETGILFPNRLKTSNVEYDKSASKQGHPRYEQCIILI